LKILFSHYGYKGGSGYSRSFQLAKELAKIGHEVYFLTTQYKKFRFPVVKEIKQGVHIYSFPEIVPIQMTRTGFGLLSLILKLFFVLFHKFDIVHSDNGHRPSSGYPCLLNRLLYKSIYISEWWDHFGKKGQYQTRPPFQKFIIGNYDLLFEKRNRKKADGVVALSKYTKKRALNYGIPENKIKIIHGGSDIDKIEYINHTQNKEKFGINKDSLTFGFIGMNKLERFDLLPFFDAMNKLSDLNINLLTTGEYLSKQFKKNYLENVQIHELGWLKYSDFAKAISCVDVFVLLSKENDQNKARWPNKLGDYLAAGRMILANPWGEIETMAKKYKTMFYITEWNSISVEKTIMKIFNNKEHLIEQAYQNRKIAETEYSWRQKAIELSKFYLHIYYASGTKTDFNQ